MSLYARVSCLAGNDSYLAVCDADGRRKIRFASTSTADGYYYWDKISDSADQIAISGEKNLLSIKCVSESLPVTIKSYVHSTGCGAVVWRLSDGVPYALCSPSRLGPL